MDLGKILAKAGLQAHKSYLQIHGGKDSVVFKVEMENGIAYALRILPSYKTEQFIKEQNMIQYAKSSGVPVPNVHSVIQYGNYAAMVMEWMQGGTAFNELQQHPENAYKLGIEFGRIQALIHRISMRKSDEKTWLSPEKGETEIYNRIVTKDTYLLHLDFHPLNVLTDGERITAVIDWANASIGDHRFDIARTYSLLQLEGHKYFEGKVLNQFQEGWKEGYRHEKGSLNIPPLFLTWAGLRMKRDFGESLSEKDSLYIDEWVKNYQ